MKRCVAGVLCACLAGCGMSVPFPGRNRPPEPASEVTAPEVLVARDGAGAIMVTRDAALQRMRCIYEIGLDDRLVASLKGGERVTMYADPGQHVLAVRIRPENDCKPALAQVPIDVVAHATTRVRIVADASYSLRIEATTR